MPSLMLQLHCLTSYPASLLNRDDAGFAKRIPFGGATRTRISSQCLKRHWRRFEGENGLQELNIPPSVRSRYTFEEHIVRPLIDEQIDERIARGVGTELMAKVLGQSAKAKAAKSKASDDDGNSDAVLKTGQVTVLGRPEVEFLLGLARRICTSVKNEKEIATAVKRELTKDAVANLREIPRGAGLDAALFGRMVTSDILARGDAAVHVAHAFTVHEEATESDYFSAVDDLQEDRDEEAMGSGHIGTAELTTGLFYSYVVVDVPLLVSNLGGGDPRDWRSADRTLASEVARRLVHLVATVSPGAKRGSTAPYAHAHLILAESGSAQPRTFANAFLAPVRQKPDVVRNAYEALRTHVCDLDGMYGMRTVRRVAGIGPVHELPAAIQAERGTLGELADWVAAQVLQ